MKSKELQHAIGQETKVEGPKDFRIPLEELIRDEVQLGAMIVWWNRWRAEHAKERGIIEGHPPRLGLMMESIKSAVINQELPEAYHQLDPATLEEYHVLAIIFIEDYEQRHSATVESKKLLEKRAVA